ncbi:MAG TPA: hypothetical protein VN046_10035 [Stenotrophobium sp.]|nr:hypothetical protein [Stenotrophobium sp.]
MNPKRHFVIPDRQAKHGVPLEHNLWVGKAIRDYKPDVVVDLGDNTDFPSLSTHEAAGSLSKEGQRLKLDIEASNRAEELLRRGMGKFKPKRMIRLRGNHEWRAQRYIDANPVLEGLVGLHLLNDRGWEVVPYFMGSPQPIVVDGVCYAHYFPNPNTGKPINGTVLNRLAQIGTTFVQGHVQGLLQGNRQYATGIVRHGIVAGSCYLHDELYKGVANLHWRGVVVLNEVRNGTFCEMPLTLDYLCRRYEGVALSTYLRKKYKHAEQRFLCARKDAA